MLFFLLRFGFTKRIISTTFPSKKKNNQQFKVKNDMFGCNFQPVYICMGPGVA